MDVSNGGSLDIAAYHWTADCDHGRIELEVDVAQWSPLVVREYRFAELAETPREPGPPPGRCPRKPNPDAGARTPPGGSR